MFTMSNSEDRSNSNTLPQNPTQQIYSLSRYHGQEERREESHLFYLRAGGASFLYIHCQALPAPSHSFFRRSAAGRLPSGPGLLPSSLGGAVPVRCCFGMLPSGNVPSRANMHLRDTYPMHPYQLRVTLIKPLAVPQHEQLLELTELAPID